MKKYVCPLYNTQQYKDVLEILGSKTRLDALYISKGMRLPTVQEAREDVKRYVDIDKESTSTRLESMLQDKSDSYTRVSRRIESLKSKLRRNTSKDRKLDRKKLLDLEKRQFEIRSEIDNLNKAKSLEVIDEQFVKDIKKIDDYLNEGTSAGVIEAIKLYNSWNNILTLENTMLLSEEELSDPGENIKAFKERAGRYKQIFANKFNEDIYPAANEMMDNIVDANYADTLSEEMQKLIKNKKLTDVGDAGGSNVIEAHIMEIAESQELSYQIAHQLQKEAISKANYQINDIIQKVRDAFNDISKEEMDLFFGTISNTDNRKSSQLTSIFTDEFETKRLNILSEFNNLVYRVRTDDKISEKQATNSIKRGSKAAIKKLKDLQINVNPNILAEIPEDDLNFYMNTSNKSDEQIKNTKAKIKRNYEAEKVQHEAELKEALGGDEELYNRYIRELNEKINTYKSGLALLKEDSSGLSSEEYTEVINNYIKDNSPFLIARHYEVGYVPGFKLGQRVFNQELMVNIARRTNENGNDTGFYDNNFSKIMSSPKLRKAYWLAYEIFMEAYNTIPRDQLKGAQPLSILSFERDFLEIFGQSGALEGAKAFYDKLKLFAANKQSQVVPSYTQQKTQVEGLQNPHEFFKTNLAHAIAEYKEKHPAIYEDNPNKDIPVDVKQDLRAQLTQEMYENNTNDLVKILQSYATSAIIFRNKAAVEDSVGVIHNVINSVTAQKITNIQQRTDKKNPKEAARLQNDLDRLNNTVASFYGYSTKKKTSDKAPLKTLVAEKDKPQYNRLKKSLERLDEQAKEGKIGDKDYAQKKQNLITQIEGLEYRVDKTTMLDGLNQYIRLKSIGWNIFSGVANIGFGFVANTLLAADGRNFTMKDLKFGYRVAAQSTLKAGSFNSIQTGQAKKASNIMRVWDILKKSKHEVIEKKIDRTKNTLQTLSPWNFMERGEYFNQVPVVIAMLRNRKVTYNGKEMTMWDLIQEDGTFPEDVGEEIMNKMYNLKVNMDRHISRAHGNYDVESPLMANNRVLIRMLKTFRTWLPQAYFSRFGHERPSIATGTVEKGRWVSWKDVFNNGIGGRDTKQTIAFIGKQLIRKLWTNTEFDYYQHVQDPSKTLTVEDYSKLSQKEQDYYERAISRVDAANMRANLTELYMAFTSLITANLLYAVLKAQDPDDDKKMLRFMLNIINRVQSDLFMWISPNDMQMILKDPMPVTGFIDDVIKVSSDIIDVASGAKPAEIQTGNYAEENRIRRGLFRILPAFNAGNNLQSLGRSVYKSDEPLWYGILSSDNDE